MVKEERCYRPACEFRAKEDEEYIVEGYATTFDDPYPLYDDGETKIYEQVSPRAFDKADMSDVIMQYDHAGKVFARISNGTLQLQCDDHGMKIRADLSRSAAARDLYEEIKSGLITKMSFAFTVAEDEYDKKTYTRTITGIRKVYDVSAVSIPANEGTEISARNFVNGVLEAERAERLEAERIEAEECEQRKRIALKAKL